MEIRCAAGLPEGEHLCGNLTWIWHQDIPSRHLTEKQATNVEEWAHGATYPTTPSLMGDPPHPSLCHVLHAVDIKKKITDFI